MDDSVFSPKHTLPPSVYSDPEVFAQAKETLFFRSWQFACHESVVPEPGDYFAFSLLDQDLFVVRQKDGALRCFYNVCQHRGHPLVENSGRARHIVCPYHGWSYELDGRLRAAPGTKKLDAFPKDSICLGTVRLESFCGFLFVNLDPAAVSLHESFPGVEDAIRSLCPMIDERLFACEHAAEERCNWLIAVENYNECYHCKMVHSAFANGVIDPQSYGIESFAEDVKCLRHSARAQTGRNAWYDTSGSPYGAFFLWPAFSLQIYPSGLVNTYHWRPQSPALTRVHRGWYSVDGAIDDALQNVIDLDRETTFTEDLRLVERVQRGVSSRGFRPGALVINPAGGIDSEHSIATLHRWLCEAIQDPVVG